MGSSCLGKSDGDIYVLNPLDKAENRLMAIVNAGFDHKIKIIVHLISHSNIHLMHFYLSC